MDTDEDDRKPAARRSGSDEDCHEQEPPTNKRKVKPALKKNAKPRKRGIQLKWDEPTIEEHDKERGTRKPILEPKTPFANYDSGAESEDSQRAHSPGGQKNVVNWDLLQVKLESVEAVRQAYPSSPSSHAGDTDQSDVEEETKREMAKLEFAEHRKRHYNEMERVRQFRQQHPDVEDDLTADADVEDGNEDDGED